MPWQHRYDRAATQGIYKVYELDRMVAAEVTEAIRTLAKDPRPRNSRILDDGEKLESDKEKEIRRMTVATHIVDYEIIEDGQWIFVLFVE